MNNESKIVDRLKELNSQNYDDNFQEISDLVEELFTVLNSENIGELVAGLVSDQSISPEFGAKLLNMSRWSGSTNGEELTLTLEQWLQQGNDAVKIDLALHQNIFLFTEAKEMESVLTNITQQFPQFKEIIQNKIIERQKQGV